MRLRKVAIYGVRTRKIRNGRGIKGKLRIKVIKEQETKRKEGRREGTRDAEQKEKKVKGKKEEWKQKGSREQRRKIDNWKGNMKIGYGRKKKDEVTKILRKTRKQNRKRGTEVRREQ